jgi:hypothetical protein
MSQKFMKDRLKAPATAQFQDVSEADVNYLGDGTYWVLSHVDSQNSFGAMLRTQFRCKVKDIGGDKWSLLELEQFPRGH